MSDLLRRPAWTSLSTRHARFAVGGMRARRFLAEIGPLAAARDDDPESLAELAGLATHGPLLLLQADPIVVPPGLVVTTSAMGVQLVLGRLAGDGDADAAIAALAPQDVPAMLALTALTAPGPFAPRTIELGDFFGVKERGQLVAMAGERMKHEGLTEVSGVCVHPDARGRGLARRLSLHVARRILARGETPYLHAYAANTPAIRLYESLGFELRREMHGALLSAAR